MVFDTILNFEAKERSVLGRLRYKDTKEEKIGPRLESNKNKIKLIMSDLDRLR